MSASTEKKVRKADKAAGTDKKTLAMQEEAKKKAKSKRKWTIGTIITVLLIAFVIIMNTSLVYTGTTAVKVGDRSFSPAEFTYNYANQYFTFANNYGSYASYFGLDTSYGLNGLASQECSMTDGGTWKDYFVEQTESNLKQLVALNNYADENGISLDDDEKAEIAQSFVDLEETAKSYGYANAAKFLAGNYGKGVNKKVASDMESMSHLASKAYSALQDSFEFTDEELEDYYKENADTYDTFSYVYYLVEADKEDVEEDGETKSKVTDDTLAAAKDTADAVAEAYKSAEGANASEKLTAALAEAGITEQPSESKDTSGSYVSTSYSEFIKDASRKAGDITVCEDASHTGYYVVVFEDRGGNDYNVAQVRHILVKAEADENGEFTDEAKAAAKAKAEDILDQWKAGDATEESFAALAEEFSEDTGSNTNGGLYEDIKKGQTVEEFNDFCFNGKHKAGDTAIVYGDNGSYAGYHVMYYVGEGENCRKAMAKEDLSSEKLSTWLEENAEPLEVEKKFFYKFAGKV